MVLSGHHGDALRVEHASSSHTAKVTTTPLPTGPSHIRPPVDESSSVVDAPVLGAVVVLVEPVSVGVPVVVATSSTGAGPQAAIVQIVV